MLSLTATAAAAADAQELQGMSALNTGGLKNEPVPKGSAAGYGHF